MFTHIILNFTFPYLLCLYMIGCLQLSLRFYQAHIAYVKTEVLRVDGLCPRLVNHHSWPGIIVHGLVLDVGGRDPGE